MSLELDLSCSTVDHSLLKSVMGMGDSISCIPTKTEQLKVWKMPLRHQIWLYHHCSVNRPLDICVFLSDYAVSLLQHSLLNVGMKKCLMTTPAHRLTVLHLTLPLLFAEVSLSVPVWVLTDDDVDSATVCMQWITCWPIKTIFSDHYHISLHLFPSLTCTYLQAIARKAVFQACK